MALICAQGVDFGYGGGIYIESFISDPEVSVLDSIFVSNSAGVSENVAVYTLPSSSLTTLLCTSFLPALTLSTVSAWSMGLWLVAAWPGDACRL
jgi:hypothetical protein